MTDPQIRKSLRRHEIPNQARFITFSCRDRAPFLGSPESRDALVTSLVKARATYQFQLFAWVVMPEHVHLVLVPNLPDFPVSKILWGLKRGASTRIKKCLPHDGATADPKGSRAFHLWQPGGGYDRNIRDTDELIQKLNYCHDNPVKRGLVTSPTDWPWSSARWYAGDHHGPIQIDPPAPPRCRG